MCPRIGIRAPICTGHDHPIVESVPTAGPPNGGTPAGRVSTVPVATMKRNVNTGKNVM
jgi:hypothetical protein